MMLQTARTFQFSNSLQRLGFPLEFMAAFVFIIFIEWVGWFAPFRALGERALLPVMSVAAAVIKGAQEPFYIVTMRGVRLDEHRTLQHQYAQALVQISQLEATAAENKLLREALDARLPDLKQRVLAVPILTADGTYISAGTEDGVRTGSVVLADGIFAGFIRHQTAHQSQIVPLHQTTMENPLLVKTERGAAGLVYGDGKQILLKNVSRDGVLAQGDRVVTAGQEGVQAGLLIGTVRVVDTRPSAPTLSGVLDQPVSLYEVSLVEVW